MRTPLILLTTLLLLFSLLSGCGKKSTTIIERKAFLEAINKGDLGTVNAMMQDFNNNQLVNTPFEGGVARVAEDLNLVNHFSRDTPVEGSAMRTPLMFAVDRGNNKEEIVNFLLEHGADIGATDIKGMTALHWAAGYGNSKAIKLLLDNGADKNTTDNIGKRPIDYARVNSDRDAESLDCVILLARLPDKFSTVETTDENKLMSALKPGTKIGDVCVNTKDGAKMVWVPAGEFLMGSNGANERLNNNEKPQRKVFLDGYWIYKYEVTVAQYHKFCLETLRPIEKKNIWGYTRGKPSWGWIDNHPIVNVSWQDATAYAKWAGGSLPTEAQWEKAARGTDGREYPWGNLWDASKCNERTKRPRKTRPVGSYPTGVSPYGCMDMAGNAMEWCADWFGQTYYNSAPSRNPTGPSESDSSAYRVQRGGCWNITTYYLRCASRSFNDPDRGEDYYGFRLVR